MKVVKPKKAAVVQLKPRTAAKASNGSQKGAKCPVCAKPAVAASAPFCSKRCADVDLGRWLDGDYRIPTAEEGDWPQGGEAEDD